jgi:plasmid stabilization system protein ParE
VKVYLSIIAETKLLKLSEYLLENWSLKSRDEFLNKFTEKINQISTQPKSCPSSNELKGLYKCVVTKQTTFYYRIQESKKKSRLSQFLTQDRILKN